MFQAILIVLLLLAAGFAFWTAKGYKNEPGYVPKWGINAAGVGLSVLAVLMFVGLSVVYVDKNEIVLLDKVYFGNSMPTGQIVAKADQNGPQAKVLNPGFKFIPFVRFEYDLEPEAMITIQPNQYGIVTAKDGSPLPSGQVIADIYRETCQNNPIYSIISIDMANITKLALNSFITTKNAFAKMIGAIYSTT